MRNAVPAGPRRHEPAVRHDAQSSSIGVAAGRLALGGVDPWLPRTGGADVVFSHAQAHDGLSCQTPTSVAPRGAVVRSQPCGLPGKRRVSEASPLRDDVSAKLPRRRVLRCQQGPRPSMPSTGTFGWRAPRESGA